MATYTQHPYYGKLLELKANGYILRLTVDVGPRAIYYGTSDKNVFFNDLNNVIHNDGEYFDSNFKKGESWKIYGGHRLWKSPEDMSSYAPDNYPVEVVMLGENKVELKNPVEKMTGIKKSVIYDMHDDGSVTVTHSFTNNSNNTINASLWALSVMAPGGKALVPISDLDTGLLANRNFVYWSYANENDLRYNIDDKYLTLTQDSSDDAKPFKVGTYDNFYVAGYKINGLVFVKKFTSFDGKLYPDFCCNIELYTCKHMLELETLSPIYSILPSDTYSHVETWSLTIDETDQDSMFYDIVMSKQ